LFRIFAPIILSTVTITASRGMQTDNKLLEYIAELEDALKTARKEILQLRDQIDSIREYKDVLRKERSKYRNLWMTERRYSQQLEDAGAEVYGGFGQARSSESSSPYYHDQCMSFIYCSLARKHLHVTRPYLIFRI
jgi:regulator of replication initiation timing